MRARELRAPDRKDLSDDEAALGCCSGMLGSEATTRGLGNEATGPNRMRVRWRRRGGACVHAPARCAAVRHDAADRTNPGTAPQIGTAQRPDAQPAEGAANPPPNPPAKLPNRFAPHRGG